MADIDVAITKEDLDSLIKENPTVSLQLQLKALTRKCQEQADRIAELESRDREEQLRESIEQEGD
jgi:ABC-type enterochelin transport system substrate-binding protein